jgi:CRP-like cAMP-binding protein
MPSSVDLNLVEVFRKTPLFSGLEQSELKELLRLSEPCVFMAGSRLFSEGDDGDGMYLIERGDLSVTIARKHGRDLVLAHLGNGAVIGEMSLIDGGTRSASVAAVSQTQGYFLSREAFAKLRRSGLPAAYKLILQLARTLDQRRLQLEDRIDQLREDPEIEAMLAEKTTRELIARVRKA